MEYDTGEGGFCLFKVINRKRLLNDEVVYFIQLCNPEPHGIDILKQLLWRTAIINHALLSLTTTGKGKTFSTNENT